MNLNKLASKALILRVLGAAASYIFVVIASRVLDIDEFGILATIMSSSLLFSVIGCVGQRQSILRFIPAVLEDNNQYLVRAYIKKKFQLAFLGNSVIFLLYIAYIISTENIDDNKKSIYLVCSLIIPLVALVDMQAHLARVFKKIFLALAPKDLLWRTLSIFIILSYITITSNKKIELEIVALILIAVLVTLIVFQKVNLTKHGLHYKDFFSRDLNLGPEILKWKKAIIPLWITSVAAIFATNADVVLVGFAIGENDAALYFSASRLALLPTLFIFSYNVVLSPLLSVDFDKGRFDDLNEKCKKSSIIVFVLTFISVLAMLILSKWLLLLFGPEYHQAEIALYFLLLSSIFNVLFGPNMLIITMCGEEKLACKLSIFELLVTLVLIVVAVSFGKIEIVALSVSISILISRLTSWFFVKNKFGIDLFVPKLIFNMRR